MPSPPRPSSCSSPPSGSRLTRPPSGRSGSTSSRPRSCSPSPGSASSGCWPVSARARWGWLAEARDIVRGTVVVLALTLSLLFLLHQDDVSRLFLALLFVVQPAVMLAGRAALRGLVREPAPAWAGHELHAHRRHRPARAGLRRPDRVARRARHQGRRPPESSAAEADPSVSRPILGTIDEINAVFRTHVIDEVGDVPRRR